MAEIPNTLPFDNAERGSIAIMGAFSLMAMILITGIVYDFGLWFATRAELQHVADTAAMAGGRALGATHAGGRFFDGTQFRDPPKKLFSLHSAGLSSVETAWIKGAINNSGVQNKAGGISISIPPGDIKIGKWKSDTNDFDQALFPKNAVQVTATRDGLAAMFGQLVGIMDYDLTATSTAALTPLQYVPPAIPPYSPPLPGTLPPGQIIFPVGVNEVLLPGPGCPGPLTLGGDFVSFPQCEIGWTTFNDDSTPENFITIADAAITPTPKTPQTQAGTGGTKYFFGGSGHEEAMVLRTIWEDNDDNWETLLPVYQDNCGPGGEPGGSDPPIPWGQQIPIVGFVSVIIAGIEGADRAIITFQCDVFGTGRSGDVNDPNLDYGTFGSVPVLVQ